ERDGERQRRQPRREAADRVHGASIAAAPTATGTPWHADEAAQRRSGRKTIALTTRRSVRRFTTSPPSTRVVLLPLSSRIASEAPSERNSPTRSRARIVSATTSRSEERRVGRGE